MGLFIDSAKIEEVEQAVELGFIAGVTTNPTLMARATETPQRVIRRICAVSPGAVFFQVTGATLEERGRVGREFYAICPDKIILKVPATTGNMALIDLLADEIPCAATAVYSAAQALVACEAGARFVIPYVNRATRLLGDGCKLVEEMRDVLDSLENPAEILAASIKSPEEAVKAILAGADHLTLPLDILLALGNHPLSDAAIAEFEPGR